MNFKEAKGHIRNFMQEHYTDERLAMLLAHAQSGRLDFQSCCCFIGAATADHPLRSATLKQTFLYYVPTPLSVIESGEIPHYDAAGELCGAEEAEEAYYQLASTNRKRRRILIPMIRAEMKRRAADRDREEVKEEASHEFAEQS